MAAATGTRVFGTAKKIHTGSGRLLGYVISHNQSAAQSVTFYDNTAASGTVLHKVFVSPESCPVVIKFSKDDGIIFATGLTVDPGSCDVAVWAVGY